MTRPARSGPAPALLSALLLALPMMTAAPSAARAQTETPSSKPSPSPGAPPPPAAAPREEAASTPAGAPDRSAAQAAVRAQCAADRAQVCPHASGVGALACLSGSFAKLSPDCQSAVTALKEAQVERGGGR